MDERLLVKVSQWYYLQGLTQETIAQKVGISRSTISRLLTQAKKRGIVKFNVSSVVRGYDVDLERRLEEVFGLQEAAVYDGSVAESPVFLARTGADILVRSLAEGAVIGLSWGRSVAAVVDHVPIVDPPVKNLTVVALSGGIGSSQPEIMSNSLVAKLASKLKASAALFNAPVVVQNRFTRDILMKESSIAPVIEIASHADVALVGIGAVGQFSTLSTLSHLESSSFKELMQRGAVGDICSRFYTIKGQPVSSELDSRTLGIPLLALKTIPRVIAVAWGIEKKQAILGALHMGIIEVLVTDRYTAEAILDSV